LMLLTSKRFFLCFCTLQSSGCHHFLWTSLLTSSLAWFRLHTIAQGKNGRDGKKSNRTFYFTFYDKQKKLGRRRRFIQIP
jgi:hypothetical protein